MDRRNQAILEDLKRNLQSIYGDNLCEIILYGSTARHEDVAGSDIDVAVILNDFADYWQEIKRTSHIVSELSLKYGKTISLYRVRLRDWQRKSTPLLENIRQEGVPA